MSATPASSSMAMDTFEVSSRDSVADHHEMNLPPVDRGRRAWLFLAACFVIEALIWGMLREGKRFLMVVYANPYTLRFHFFVRYLPGLLQHS